MAWVYLLCAGLFEVAWAVGLKSTRGFTQFWPTVGVVAAMGASLYLLGLAVRHLPIGTAYAVWTGIGALGTAVCGMVLLGEARDWPRLACLGLILVGIVGLRAVTGRA
jgi:quaternary ammonium compound-resistance protein SugE